MYFLRPDLDFFKKSQPTPPPAKTGYARISKVKTFTPPSQDGPFIYRQALLNLESAYFKAQRYSLSANRLYLFLRRHDFQEEGIELAFSLPDSLTLDLSMVLSAMFKKIYRPKVIYRSTGIVLKGLEPSKTRLRRPTELITSHYGEPKIHLVHGLTQQLG